MIDARDQSNYFTLRVARPLYVISWTYYMMNAMNRDVLSSLMREHRVREDLEL